MSRELDLDNLSEEDKVYISQRELLRSEIIAVTGEDPLEGWEPDQELHEDVPRPNQPGTPFHGSATVESPLNPQEEPRLTGNYDSAPNKNDLKKEIDKRNEDREDDAKIVPEGSKRADLVAALEEDDEVQNLHNSDRFPEGDPDADDDEDDES